MSEVKRYPADEQYPGQYSARCDLVPASAYDAAQSQLAALREELDGYRAANMVLRDEVKTERLRGDAAVGDANEAEQRLADAERRNVMRDAQLSKATDFVERLCASAGNQPSIATGYLRDILDALNPNPEAASHDE